MQNKTRFDFFGAAGTASVASVAVFAFLASGLTGCAGILIKAPLPAVAVEVTDRLLLRVVPFDDFVKAELERASLDPARVEEEFAAEVRYGLFRRGQEEAQDSASAEVIVDVRVRHLQAGVANIGAYAAFDVTSWRPAERKNSAPATDTLTWTSNRPAKENVPAAFTARHLTRLAAGEVLTRIQPPRKEREPPPPLHLMR
jgi:hypothetical protein